MQVSKMTGDGCQVKALEARYNLKKSAVYDRLSKLNIKAANIRGVGSFVSEEQLRALDEYDRQLQLGDSGLSTTPTGQAGISDAQSILAVLPTVMQLLTDRASTDLMANYRQLQEASDRGWFLPTLLVRQLIGVTPHGASFERCGFRFEPAAKHRSTEWRVSNITV